MIGVAVAGRSGLEPPDDIGVVTGSGLNYLREQCDVNAHNLPPEKRLFSRLAVPGTGWQK